MVLFPNSNECNINGLERSDFWCDYVPGATSIGNSTLSFLTNGYDYNTIGIECALLSSMYLGYKLYNYIDSCHIPGKINDKYESIKNNKNLQYASIAATVIASSMILNSNENAKYILGGAYLASECFKTKYNATNLFDATTNALGITSSDKKDKIEVSAKIIVDANDPVLKNISVKNQKS